MRVRDVMRRVKDGEGLAAQMRTDAISCIHRAQEAQVTGRALSVLARMPSRPAPERNSGPGCPSIGARPGAAAIIAARIFRLIVGAALLARDGRPMTTSGRGDSATSHIVKVEDAFEREGERGERYCWPYAVALGGYRRRSRTGFFSRFHREKCTRRARPDAETSPTFPRPSTSRMVGAVGGRASRSPRNVTVAELLRGAFGVRWSLEHHPPAANEHAGEGQNRGDESQNRP